MILKLEWQYFGYWCEELTHWKSPWFWERLKAGGEGDDREWDGWMASLTRWTWVWASSRRWRRTGKPGMLQSMGSQKNGHDWVTEQQNLVVKNIFISISCWFSCYLPLAYLLLSVTETKGIINNITVYFTHKDRKNLQQAFSPILIDQLGHIIPIQPMA